LSFFRLSDDALRGFIDMVIIIAITEKIVCQHQHFVCILTTPENTLGQRGRPIFKCGGHLKQALCSQFFTFYQSVKLISILPKSCSRFDKMDKKDE
jgi:hypothetical protein